MYDWLSQIPPHVADIIQTLRQRGHIVYVVGGAVRDLLLGHKPKDFDLVTSARPDDISAIFPKTLDIGKHFGISMIVTELGNVEVATFRADGDYGDSRHPDSVRFASPQEDAVRRDFTINGLFWDPDTLEVLDYVEGLKDIKDRRIRAIGDPEKRFSEDALRVLRALRFLSQLAPYHFRLDVPTLQAVAKMCPTLVKVSRERITAEMNFILVSKVPSLALAHIRDIGLWWNWFGGIELKPEALAALDHFGAEVPMSLRWSALVSGAGNWPEAEKALGNFLLPKGAKDEIHGIYLAREKILVAPTMGLAELKEFLKGAEGALRFYGEIFKNSEVEFCQKKRQEFLTKGTLDPAPLLTGKDLIQMGFAPGPKMKEILAEIRRAQLEEKVSSRDKALQLAATLSQN